MRPPGTASPTCSWNSARRNATWRMTPKTVPTTWWMELRQLTLSAHLGSVNICAYNFFVCGPKFANFFSTNVGAVVVDSYFSDFQHVDPFREYSRSKSKVVRNRAGFWTFFLPSQILGGRPSKNCTHVITPGSRHVAWIKICDDIPISPEVIDV